VVVVVVVACFGYIPTKRIVKCRGSLSGEGEILGDGMWS
jgi:hypothetical protein